MSKSKPPEKMSKEENDAWSALNHAVVRGEPERVLKPLRRKLERVQAEARICKLGPLSDAIAEFAERKRNRKT